MRPGYYDYVVAAHLADPGRTAGDLARGFGVHVNTVEMILRDAADRGVAIRRLPPGAPCKYDREAVLDALARDLTVPLHRIARRFGLSVHTLRSPLTRARRMGDPRAAPRPSGRPLSARFGRGARA